MQTLVSFVCFFFFFCFRIRLVMVAAVVADVEIGILCSSDFCFSFL